jgi:large subunit ribosomal protein L10
MAVTRAKKTEQVEKLSQELKNVSNVVVATYTKMTVAQDYELRKALRGAGAKYQVVKNTLAERAAKGTKVEGALKDLAGVTSIAYTMGDPVAMAKALTKYAKDAPEFTFKVGVVEGRVISIKEIEALATMPSKEELMSKLLFLINAPAQRSIARGARTLVSGLRGPSTRARGRGRPRRISSGWRKPSEKIWLPASRGLRGWFRALSGARKRTWRHWNPDPGITKSKNGSQTDNKVEK